MLVEFRLHSIVGFLSVILRCSPVVLLLFCEDGCGDFERCVQEAGGFEFG